MDTTCATLVPPTSLHSRAWGQTILLGGHLHRLCASSKRPRRFLALLAAVLALGLTTYGQDGPDAEPAAMAIDEIEGQQIRTVYTPSETFVGTVDGTDTYIAVVARNTSVVAYICDNARLAVWFEGTINGMSVTAAAQGGETIAAVLKKTQLIGWLTMGKTTTTFTAVLALYPAGLWEGFDVPSTDREALSRYGWIVLADGAQRGAKMAGETVEAVGDVDTHTGVGDGVQTNPTPPPLQPTMEFTQKQCEGFASNFNYARDLYNDPETSAALRKKAYATMTNATSLWLSGGEKSCGARFGLIGEPSFP